MSPTPATSPTIAPTALTEAFGLTGSCQARQLAATIVLLSVRPVVAMPNSPTQHGDPPGAVRLVQRGVDLVDNSAAQPGVAHVALAHRTGEEAEEADEEQEQGYEEQEQPKRDRRADHRAGRLAVAVVDPHSDVDERAVLVPVVGLLRLVSARRDPVLSALDQAFPEGGLAIKRRVLW